MKIVPDEVKQTSQDTAYRPPAAQAANRAVPSDPPPPPPPPADVQRVMTLANTDAMIYEHTKKDDELQKALLEVDKFFNWDSPETISGAAEHAEGPGGGGGGGLEWELAAADHVF